MNQSRLLLLFLLLLLPLIPIACGGKPAITVTVSPLTANVFTTQNQQFAATVANTSTTTVTWEVNDIIGGNSTIGVINPNGLYTAPDSVPNPASVTITAVPTADTKISATATVTVQLGANLSITPSSLELDTNAQQTFTVMSNGSPAQGVVFSLSCKSTAPGACGSITSDGTYTAPGTPPPNDGNVIVTATITEGSGSFSTSAVVTVVTP